MKQKGTLALLIAAKALEYTRRLRKRAKRELYE
jgi:hypothetical protein